MVQKEDSTETVCHGEGMEPRKWACTFLVVTSPDKRLEMNPQGMGLKGFGGEKAKTDFSDQKTSQ